MISYEIWLFRIDELNDSFPRVIDQDVCNHMIQVLSVTDRWKNSLDLFYRIKRPAAKSYFSVIGKALKENEADVAWQLLDQCLSHDIIPSCQVFLDYWNFCRLSESSFVENVERIMAFIGRHEILVSQLTVNELMKVLRENGHQVELTNVSNGFVSIEAIQ